MTLHVENQYGVGENFDFEFTIETFEKSIKVTCLWNMISCLKLNKLGVGTNRGGGGWNGGGGAEL